MRKRPDRTRTTKIQAIVNSGGAGGVGGASAIGFIALIGLEKNKAVTRRE